MFPELISYHPEQHNFHVQSMPLSDTYQIFPTLGSLNSSYNLLLGKNCACHPLKINVNNEMKTSDYRWYQVPIFSCEKALNIKNKNKNKNRRPI